MFMLDKLNEHVTKHNGSTLQKKNSIY